ncbi:Transcription factor BTF3 [Larimichthys crocea]|uniref:Uncharacterized protein n=1 Tax=Larimichthys crocea TaxID=215358 RepID=A0ACD3QLA6_LARCR|nr:Transcription factor BTF3 [Larimichthys crocea]
MPTPQCKMLIYPHQHTQQGIKRLSACEARLRAAAAPPLVALLFAARHFHPPLSLSLPSCSPHVSAVSLQMKEAIMNQEKLAKLQAQVRIGGKGSARRKKKVVHRTATADDKKLQFSLKKLGVNNISGIEEVNMFTNQGTVIHFNNPKVQASLACQHLHHHRPRRDQAAHRNAAGYPEPAGSRQSDEPQETCRGPPQTGCRWKSTDCDSRRRR